MIKGTPKFNTIEIEHISVRLGNGDIRLGGQAAYRSDLDDAQHGAIYFNDDALWSKEALEAARELTRAMERDLAKQHFEDGAEHTEPEAETARGSGVGEFFREPEDAAQV